jgi:excisionase family DNA binding protein
MVTNAPTENTVTATPAEVARHLKVTTPTVLRWFRHGIIPARIAVGRVYRFDLAEVEAALVAASKKGGTR